MTADPSRARSVGITERCLSHRFFWPAYVALIVVGLTTLRPWESPTFRRTHRAFGVEVHQEPLQSAAHADVGVVLMASEALGPPGSDWLLCDGSRVAKADHEKLATLIGSRFGDGGEDGFRLPDYRGLRCYMDAARGSLGTVLVQWVQVTPTSPGSDPFPTAALGESGISYWIKAK